MTFNDDALDCIVNKAIENKTGARGLRNVVEDVMAQPMYELPSSNKTKYIVTKKAVEKILNN